MGHWTCSLSFFSGYLLQFMCIDLFFFLPPFFFGSIDHWFLTVLELRECWWPVYVVSFSRALCTACLIFVILFLWKKECDRLFSFHVIFSFVLWEFVSISMLGSDKCPCSADLNRCNDDLNCLGSEGVLRLSFGCFVSLRCPASTFKNYFYIFNLKNLLKNAHMEDCPVELSS